MNDEPSTPTESASEAPLAPMTDPRQQDRPTFETLADRPDRLTPAVAVGVMALLLLCAALVLVAWNRAPV